MPELQPAPTSTPTPKSSEAFCFTLAKNIRIEEILNEKGEVEGYRCITICPDAHRGDSLDLDDVVTRKPTKYSSAPFAVNLCLH